MPDPHPTHDLSAQQLAELARVLAPFAGQIDSVALFGSRATGTARPNSDIDLVLYGDVPAASVDRLWTLFDGSALALKVDVLAYSQIVTPALKAHIDAVGQVLFNKAALRDMSA
jgi:uncharacterized protein